MKRLLAICFVVVFTLAGCSSTDTPATMATSPTQTTEASSQPTCYQSAMTQTELNACADQEAPTTYSTLQSLIADLRSHMDDAQYTSLLEIEPQWEAAINEHCKWQADNFAGGSVRSMQLSECLTEQYRFRIDSLRLNLCDGKGMTGECEESLKYKQ